MPHFDADGNDTYICQKCTRIFTGVKSPPTWRKDICGGNACPNCNAKFPKAEAPPVWIHAQDFVDAFIGPFANAGLAQAHIDVIIIPRGDGGTLEIISEKEFKKESKGWLIVSPEDDAKFDPLG